MSKRKHNQLKHVTKTVDPVTGIETTVTQASWSSGDPVVYEDGDVESVYIASSWRNIYQAAVVHIVRAAGFDVYDFRNPPNKTGFQWSQVGLALHINATAADGTTSGEEARITDYLAALEHPRAQEGFDADMDALFNADVCILVLPCGRSAHLELGWAVGAGKRTCVYSPEDTLTPELMYKMCDHISPNTMDLLGWLGVQD